MNEPQNNQMTELMEAIAEIEHEQWQHWSQTMAAEVSPATRERWENSWVDYHQLSDELKEADRVWARKIMALLRQHKLIQ